MRAGSTPAGPAARRPASRSGSTSAVRCAVLVLPPRASPAALAATGGGSTGRPLFADHTYLQQAQPSTVGHYLHVVRVPGPPRRRAAAGRRRVAQRQPVRGRRGQRQPPASTDRRRDRRRARLRSRHRQHPRRHVAGRRAGPARFHRRQPGLHPDVAGRGPRDLGQLRSSTTSSSGAATRAPACSCRRSATRTRCR